MSELLLLTNNPQTAQQAAKAGWPNQLLAGPPLQLLQQAQLLLCQGWRLAADPLAGYFSHHNPFQTIFLQKTTETPPADQLCLTRAISRWLGYQQTPAEQMPTVYQSYQILDSTLAAATMQQLTQSS